MESCPGVIPTCTIPTLSEEERRGGERERARQLLPKQWLYMCSLLPQGAVEPLPVPVLWAAAAEREEAPERERERAATASRTI